MNYNYLKPGIGNASSYIVSGTPWCKSFIAPSSGEITTISFPRVTKFITIKNDDSNSSIIRVGFDPKQIEYETGEYFSLSNGESISVEFKATDIYIQSQNSANIPVTVIVGLTNIETKEMPPQFVISDINLTAEQDLNLTTEDDFVIILE